MNARRFFMLMVLVSLAIVLSSAGVLAQHSGYSGDDIYDPAAGGRAYRPYAGPAQSYSGDDAYDAAADGLVQRPLRARNVSYSGDDAYDFAAGGRAQPRWNGVASR